MATTTSASLQDSGNGMTRRNVIRWVDRVAVAGALTTLGASGLSGLSNSAEASGRGKRRHKQRRQDKPQVLSSQVIESALLPEDQIDDDLGIVGYQCRKRIVCYSKGVCVYRTICR